MLIPYSTDAPLYHYPIATVSMIVLNFICFFAFWTARLDPLEAEFNPEVAAQFMDSESESGDWRDELLLHYGRGIRPWQWLTSIFLHADIVHLVGNMIFLWSFGLVLEGKMGGVVFLLLYLGMGVTESAVEQLMMFFGEGVSLGASSAIFSLLALVVIFAPLNTFETILFIGFRVFHFEAPILVFGGIYVGMNLFFFFISGASMGSEALHLLGFAIGVPIGLLLLTQGFVDCEGYDIISHYTNSTGKDSKVGKKERKARLAKQMEKEEQSLPKLDQAQVRATMVGQVEQAIREGNIDLAIALQGRISANNPGVTWSQPNLAAAIQSLLKSSEFAKAVPLMEKHIEMFEAHRFPLQVKLIKIWLKAQRPRHAIRYMRGLNPAFMTDNEKTEIQKLADFAKQQIKSGVLEVE